MKINNAKKQGISLRKTLIIAFTLFSVALLVILWTMQSVFLETYYENSMKRKVAAAANTVANAYSNTEKLYYQDFSRLISDEGTKSDVFFYLEASDGSFSMSSSDMAGPGRIFNRSFFIDGKMMLDNSGSDNIAYTKDLGNDNRAIIMVRKVESQYRNPAYLYAVAAITPLGPAVDIIRSQLLIVTGIVLVLGIIIAVVVSKRLSAPLQEMSSEAKKLGQGNFDVEFKGSGYKEINDLADTLNNAAKDLKASEQLDKDLLANVSHDLRTPLTMIKSYAEMIKDISGDNKEKREEHLDVIINETDRMAELVNDIFFLSKVQSGVEEFKDEVFDIGEIAKSIFDTYEIASQDGFEMNFVCDGEAFVLGDKSKLSQVISNFLSNAIRYSEDEKFVELRISEKGDRILLEVEDRGIGIPEDDLDKIWNRYEKSSRTGTRSKEGTGLGLSICREILKRENAEYGAANAEEGGSIFWFSLEKI